MINGFWEFRNAFLKTLSPEQGFGDLYIVQYSVRDVHICSCWDWNSTLWSDFRSMITSSLKKGGDSPLLCLSFTILRTCIEKIYTDF